MTKDAARIQRNEIRKVKVRALHRRILTGAKDPHFKQLVTDVTEAYRRKGFGNQPRVTISG